MRKILTAAAIATGALLTAACGSSHAHTVVVVHHRPTVVVQHHTTVVHQHTTVVHHTTVVTSRSRVSLRKH